MCTDRPAIEISSQARQRAIEALWEWVVTSVIDQFPEDWCDEPVDKIIKILQEEVQADDLQCRQTD